MRIVKWIYLRILERFKNLRSKIVGIIPPSKKQRLLLKEIGRNFPQVLTTKQTLEFIIANRCSIARFGDGEFDALDMTNVNDVWQPPSNELSERLREVLLSQNSKSFLVCIPPFNSQTNNLRNYYRQFTFWESYWLRRFNKLEKYLKNRTFGNSFLSRETVFYENDVSSLKKLWEDRNVVFVFGKGGRFKIEGSLFDNVRSVEVILAPSLNAFSQYKHILNECLRFSSESLFLLAIGQTATVLAYDLSVSGYQALDIGHLPNCYDQYLGISPRPESLPMSQL